MHLREAAEIVEAEQPVCGDQRRRNPDGSRFLAQPPASQPAGTRADMAGRRPAGPGLTTSPWRPTTGSVISWNACSRRAGLSRWTPPGTSPVSSSLFHCSAAPVLQLGKPNSAGCVPAQKPLPGCPATYRPFPPNLTLLPLYAIMYPVICSPV